MPVVRVCATLSGDNACDADSEDMIILHVNLNKENYIEPRMEAFGYVREFNNETDHYEKFPFVTLVKNNNLYFNFGAYAKVEIEIAITNLLDKEIIVNNYFTYFEGDDREAESWTYRIENITVI